MGGQTKDDDDEYAFIVTSTPRPGKVAVNVGGVSVDMLIDSGASTNVIDQKLWEELKKKHIECVSKKSRKKLYAYGATTPLRVIGIFMLWLRWQVHFSRVHGHRGKRRTTTWKTVRDRTWCSKIEHSELPSE